jgi:hypothetical protein
MFNPFTEVATDTLEGTVNHVFWYHCDLSNDVLYLRLLNERETETYADEAQDGVLLLHRMDNDALVACTFVNWWKRFGSGERDSIKELEKHIEPCTHRLSVPAN